MKVRPDRNTFDELASSWALVPVWTELLADVSTPVGVFPALAADGPGILLESVERSERWGRYSFAAGDPAAVVTADRRGVAIRDLRRTGLTIDEPRKDKGVREQLRHLARSLAGPRLPELPSLTGGLMGYLAYEAAELLDGQPVPSPETAPCPAIGLLVVDRAVVFDHWRQRLLLVAHVPPGAYEEGSSALEALAETISTATAPAPTPIEEDPDTGVQEGASGLANMEDARYRQIVSGFKDHILAGDIYQGVPSRRVSFPAANGGYPIYRRLRVSNPAPYMFFLRLLSMELAGSSPEPLVRVEGRRASTRPIAGTRPRGATDVRDRLL
ncbi:MAG TPA: chorismate-binding protein, partial [Actinomycetota bacterium]|nr:chorismate-binding protein [Actinomycetota bacterium]